MNEVERERYREGGAQGGRSRSRDHPLSSGGEIPDLGILKGLQGAGTAIKSGFENLTSKLSAMTESKQYVSICLISD